MVADIELIEDVEMTRIADIGELPPFLMTVVSSSDLWMFISSSGGLTAGRVDRDNCLFPYETDDRLHVADGLVGSATLLRVGTGDGRVVWEPFRGDHQPVRRSLLKSLLGDAVVFEEEHLTLGLRIRHRWAPSERFGWVRTTSVSNRTSDRTITIDGVDGVCGVMPWGVDVPLQQRMSNLANAYRRSEIAEPGIGIYSLEALIVDRPEPAEALRATTVWSTGLADAVVTLDPAAVDDARQRRPIRADLLRTGRPGSFLVHARLDLAPGEAGRWHVVADVAQDHADIERLRSLVDADDDLTRQVDDDIRRSSAALADIVASADGFQVTGSPTSDAHHLANTLFNVMRGGTFPHGNDIDIDRFRSFVAERNASAASHHGHLLSELPATVAVDELRARAAESNDPDLTRLAHEYLPLTFSRRHGDPSRPWNQFAIRVRDDHGDPILSYQGNWRDIFQNWEALTRSFPAFLPSIIAKFLNASTVDGFNPYRITDDGIDWEIIDPDDPWSGIGYWGDHQIVYLDRLLRSQVAHDPDWLAASLGVRAYAFADVPYRIVGFDDLVRDPKSTVDYDDEVAAAVSDRVARMGVDGQLVVDGAGSVTHATMLEKLLIPALTKISNYVPRGGIWMNTQRPEWNDANNALVGFGLSMVTLAYLRRYVGLLAQIGADMAGPIQVSENVVTWLGSVTDALETHDVGDDDIDPSRRMSLLRELGTSYETYRTERYAGGASSSATVAPEAVTRLTSVTLRHLDDALRAARRPDGLYHAYNLLDVSSDGRQADVSHLPVMLEGQVAVISSGLLTSDEVVDVVDAMYDSPLYRRDADSFVLYPARQRPPFLERNRVPEEAVSGNPLLASLIAAGRHDVVVEDVAGHHHFDAGLRNAGDLAEVLDRLEAGGNPLVAEHRVATLALYEEVFAHHEFTGRSSTMYAYEGIGSVYWHMVAKLLVAVQECALDASVRHDDTTATLVDRYERIRRGLGFNKTAAEYGAFPTDPYSHTPAHAGAQQPGMTGQVKEELLTRWAELGLTIERGCISFNPLLVDAREFVSDDRATQPAPAGIRTSRLDVDVAIGRAAYTFCQVPVVLHQSHGTTSITVTFADRTQRRVNGAVLDRSISKQIFDRTGDVARLDVEMSAGP